MRFHQILDAQRNRGEVLESIIALSGFSAAFLLAQSTTSGFTEMPTTLQGTVILICVISVGFFIKAMNDNRTDNKEIVKSFADSLNKVTEEFRNGRLAFERTMVAAEQKSDEDRTLYQATMKEYGSELRRLTEKVDGKK